MEYLALFIVPALWIVIYLKRHNRKIDIPAHEEVVEGTDREREEAEAALRGLPANIREHLADTHELVERFSTRHGYTSYYVEEIAKRLRDDGCEVEMIFQAGAMPGVADSILEQQGHFELWILKRDARQAREILQKLVVNPQR